MWDCGLIVGADVRRLKRFGGVGGCRMESESPDVDSYNLLDGGRKFVG